MSATVRKMTTVGVHFSLGRSTAAISKIMKIPEWQVVKLLDQDRCYRLGRPLPEYEARNG